MTILHDVGQVRYELYEIRRAVAREILGKRCESLFVANLQLGTERRDSVAFGDASGGIDSNLLRSLADESFPKKLDFDWIFR